jgi:hypothetical protein
MRLNSMHIAASALPSDTSRRQALEGDHYG